MATYSIDEEVINEELLTLKNIVVNSVDEN
jgi:hypothetical protein